MTRRALGGARGLVWRQLPWHPFLLVLAFVAQPVGEEGVDLSAAVRPTVVALVVVALVLVGFRVAARDWRIAGVISTALAAVVLSKPWIGAAAAPIGVGLVLVVVGAAVAARRQGALRQRLSSERLTSALNVLTGLLLALVTLTGVGRNVAVANAIEPPAVRAPGEASPPSIYVLLLDGYPRADLLRSAWGYDNTPFLEALNDRGFVISEESRSNYLTTRVAMLSILHMRFVHELPTFMSALTGELPLQPAVHGLVRENPAFAQLRAAGFDITATAPGIEVVSMRNVENWREGPQLNELEYALLEGSYLLDVIRLVSPGYLAAEHRARIEFSFSTLRRAVDDDRADPRPNFVWAHVLSPHMPPVVGAAGETVALPYRAYFYGDSASERDMDDPVLVETYRHHLDWLNGRVLSAVDHVLGASPRPPVIVIMSDHGSGRGLHLDDQTGSDVTERSANFFAAYTPGHDRLFAPDVTPVNLFPTLFDAYLGIGYEPRPNTTWVNVGTEFRPAELAGSAPLVDPPGQLNGVSR